MRKQAAALGPAGMVVGVFTIGLASALPLFTLIYLHFAGRIAWRSALLAAAALGVLRWGFFDRIAGIIRYPGLLPASPFEWFQNFGITLAQGFTIALH
jgi:hypothetical protein